MQASFPQPDHSFPVPLTVTWHEQESEELEEFEGFDVLESSEEHIVKVSADKETKSVASEERSCMGRPSFSEGREAPSRR